MKPRLYVLLLGQDDPKKCTAAKLSRFRFAIAVRRARALPRNTIVLDPFAQLLTRKEGRRLGCFTAVDCSWAKAEEGFSHMYRGLRRRLPHLLAANPVNYGHRDVLSSAEALAAALSISGFGEEAQKILGIFKWGPTFLSLNREPLEAYYSAHSQEELQRLEKEYFP